MSNIKLKPFKQGMVIHCPTEEEAKMLLEYLDKLGYCWCSDGSSLKKSKYQGFLTRTCYKVYSGRRVTYSNIEYFTENGFEITEFSDLIEPELEPEEVLSIYAEIVGECSGGHCSECLLSRKKNKTKGGLCHIDNIKGNERKIIEICKQWKADHEKKSVHEKKEPEVEWHFHAEVHGNGFDSIKNCDTEEEAIKFIEEELKKAGKDAYGEYKRICIVN